MPDRDDTPELDPADEAYRRAERALDDEAARAIRRARVLAAVAQEPAAAPTPSLRRPIRRYGGWLAAACVAGLSVWTAGQVYRLSSLRQQSPPPAPQPPAAPPASPASPATPRVLPPPATPRVVQKPPPVTVRRRALAAAEPTPPAPPPDDVAPPPPLPIPPVEKPIQAPRPLAPAPAAESALARAPAPLAAPVAVGKSGSVLAQPSKGVAETVVVTGSRIARRDYEVSASATSDVAQARMRLEAAKLRAMSTRLHYDAFVGRIDDIEATLAQGAPVDAADDNGETALMISIKAGQRDAAALLLRHGASLDVKNLAGVSAREMAAAKRDPELDRTLGIIPSAAAPP